MWEFWHYHHQRLLWNVFLASIMGAITSHTNKMKMLQRQLSVVMTLLCCVHFHVQCCDEVEDAISRSDFPEGFLFGTSTSSYQVLVYFFFHHFHKFCWTYVVLPLLEIFKMVFLSMENLRNNNRLKEHLLKMVGV